MFQVFGVNEVSPLKRLDTEPPRLLREEMRLKLVQRHVSESSPDFPSRSSWPQSPRAEMNEEHHTHPSSRAGRLDAEGLNAVERDTVMRKQKRVVKRPDGDRWSRRRPLYPSGEFKVSGERRRGLQSKTSIPGHCQTPTHNNTQQRTLSLRFRNLWMTFVKNISG